MVLFIAMFILKDATHVRYVRIAIVVLCMVAAPININAREYLEDMREVKKRRKNSDTKDRLDN